MLLSHDAGGIAAGVIQPQRVCFMLDISSLCDVWYFMTMGNLQIQYIVAFYISETELDFRVQVTAVCTEAVIACMHTHSFYTTFEYFSGGGSSSPSWLCLDPYILWFFEGLGRHTERLSCVHVNKICTEETIWCKNKNQNKVVCHDDQTFWLCQGLKEREIESRYT